jgi:hypothetical protein
MQKIEQNTWNGEKKAPSDKIGWKLVRKHENTAQKAKKQVRKGEVRWPRIRDAILKPLGYSSRSATYPFRRPLPNLGRTSRGRTCHLTIWMTEPYASRPKRRTVQTLHTENLKLEENMQKNIFFPKNSFRTRMYNQLIKQSTSISKIRKDIIES